MKLNQRYAINTFFDSVNTLMGVILGLYLAASFNVDLVSVSVITTAVALGISAGTSTFEAEQLEQERRYKELQHAMGYQISEAQLKKEATLIGLIVGFINFIIPLLMATIALVIIARFSSFDAALVVVIIVFLTTLFITGVGFGRLNDLNPIKRGIRMLLLGGVTFVICFLVGSIV